MDALIAFCERLVTEFSWKRVLFLFTALVLIVGGLWLFEAFTGHFRSERMKFAAELLKTLSDPELRKNVQGDPELELAHQQLKSDLHRFLTQSQVDVGVPDPLWKGATAFAPWMVLGILMYLATGLEQSRSAIGGMMALAVPLAVVGAFLPTFEQRWINYLVYPLGSCAAVVFLVIMSSKLVGRRTVSVDQAGGGGA